jgi:hypothetical protein
VLAGKAADAGAAEKRHERAPPRVLRTINLLSFQSGLHSSVLVCHDTSTHISYRLMNDSMQQRDWVQCEGFK